MVGCPISLFKAGLTGVLFRKLILAIFLAVHQPLAMIKTKIISICARLHKNAQIFIHKILFHFIPNDTIVFMKNHFHRGKNHAFTVSCQIIILHDEIKNVLM